MTYARKPFTLEPRMPRRSHVWSEPEAIKACAFAARPSVEMTIMTAMVMLMMVMTMTKSMTILLLQYCE